MKPSHAVVGGWAALNLVLALILASVFQPAGPLEQFLYIWSAALVAGFGLIVALAVRSGRVGVQQRQPRSAAAGVFAVLGLTVALLGYVYFWPLSLLGIYPLGLAAWLLLRGERLPAGVRPWPVALDDAEPAGPPRFAHQGSGVGTATAVPEQHDAHGPPRPPPPPPSRPARGAVLLLAGARALADLLRGRRR